jgi:hypothetical protein
MRRINPKSKAEIEKQRLVEQHIVKFNSPFFEVFDHLCFLSKNMYNSAIYTMRQAYSQNKGKGAADRAPIPTYYDLDKNKNVDYRAMQANWAQQTLILACKAF